MQRLYEAMFIVDSNKAKESYATLEAAAQSCITRHGGEIVKTMKWDDRRLAFDIKKAKRGTFILIHFNAEGEALAKIERQARLTEDVLRLLITLDEDGVETNTGSSRERTEAVGAGEANGERDSRRSF